MHIVRSMIFIPCLIAVLLVSICLIDRAYADTAASSGYSLIGTIQSRDFSGATIAVDKGEQTFFRLFDKLPDGSQLVKVLNDYIVLKRDDGLTYELFISHAPVQLTTAQKLWNVPGDPYAGGRRRNANSPPIDKYEARYKKRHPNGENGDE